MSNTKKQNLPHDELDIIEIFKILFHEKWQIIIITLISILIGLFFYTNQSNNYRVSIDITSGSKGVFFKYIKLNEILSTISEIVPKSPEDEKSYYSITPQEVLDKFALQFSNKVGIINAVTNSPDFEDLPDNENLKNQIIENAENFKLKKQDIASYKLNFNWPNKDQITNLVNLTINQTLNFVKEDVINDVRLINEVIKNEKYNHMIQFDDRMDFLLEQENDKIKSRLLFLNEQYQIAKKLGIQFNDQFVGKTSFNFFNSNENPFTSKSESPYYLLGYEPIDQEIKNLERRNDQDKILLSDNYLNLIGDKRNFELISKQLEKYILTLSETKDHHDGWIAYNLSSIDIFNPKKSILFFLLISGLMGLSFGIISALLTNFSRKNFNNI